MQFRCAVALALLGSAGASQGGQVQDVVASVEALPACNRVYAEDGDDLMDVVGSGLDEPTKMKGHFQGIARGYNSKCIYLSSSAEASGDIFAVKFADGKIDGALATLTGTTESKTRVHETMWHVGGISTFDDILVAGTEGSCSASLFQNGECDSIVHFFKLDKTTCQPTRLDYTIDRVGDHKNKGITSGAVALTSLASGKFLLAVGEWSNDPVRFYLSKQATMDEDPEFEEVAVLNASNMEALGKAAGLTYGGYQGIDLVRQADGKVYMIATHAMGDPVSTYLGYGNDFVDVFEIPMGEDDQPTGEMKMALRKEMSCSGGSNFRNGGGIFVPGGSSLLDLVVYSADRNTAGQGVYINEYWLGPCEKFTGATCILGGCDSSRNAVCNYVGINECYCEGDMCAENGKCVAAQQQQKKCKKPADWPQGYTNAFCSADAESCSSQDLDIYQLSCKLDSFGKANVLCKDEGGTFMISGCTVLDTATCSKSRDGEADCGDNECAVIGMCIDVSRSPTCNLLSQAGTQYNCPIGQERKSDNADVSKCMSKTTKDAYDNCFADLCCEQASEAGAAAGLSLTSLFQIACVIMSLQACSRCTV